MIFGFVDHVLDSKPSGSAPTADPLTVTIQPACSRFGKNRGTARKRRCLTRSPCRRVCSSPRSTRSFVSIRKITSTGSWPSVPTHSHDSLGCLFLVFPWAFSPRTSSVGKAGTHFCMGAGPCSLPGASFAGVTGFLMPEQPPCRLNLLSAFRH